MKTIIIPPRNIITRVYDTHKYPALWTANLNVNEKITNPRLIIKGDLAINTSIVEQPNNKRIMMCVDVQRFLHLEGYGVLCRSEPHF